MVIFKSLRSINEWHKTFAFKPVRIYRTELVDGIKMEFSEVALFCTVERRVRYTSGLRQGTEYRWPENNGSKDEKKEPSEK